MKALQCACILFGLGVTGLAARAHTPAEEMAEAAGHFLASLTSEQRAKVTFAWNDEERFNWHFIPRPRKGLSFKELTSAQKPLAHALLSTGLSQRGYVKAVTIMSLEQVLRELEGGKGQFTRDPELYYVSIFGTPGQTWGWRVEGHHLSVNFTIAGGKEIVTAPTFLGSNPAEVKQGPRKGLRVLAAEEDLARQLVKSLNDEQRKATVFDSAAPGDILTEAKRKVSPLAPAGLAAAQMGAEQRDFLMRLVREYVQRCRPEVADRDLEKIQEAGAEKIHFAWAGGLEKGQGHYYRVQGPTFLLEYDCTQNDANHIHAVWRDFENDFGEDLLKRHYEAMPHGGP